MLKLIIGLIIASVCWFFMFSKFPQTAVVIHNNYFWYAMSLSTLLLTIYGLVNQKHKLKKLFEIKLKFILIGVLHAIILYGISRLGAFIISYFFDFAVPQLQEIYSTRSQASPILISILLLFIIAPAEEIFWRGYVQDKFSELFSPQKALVLTTIIYSLVHIWALNPMLMLAAVVLGLHWGFLYRKFNSVIPGLVSHAIWDTLIFVILPVGFN